MIPVSLPILYAKMPRVKVDLEPCRDLILDLIQKEHTYVHILGILRDTENIHIGLTQFKSRLREWGPPYSTAAATAANTKSADIQVIPILSKANIRYLFYTTHG
jgi:hypothetical protein